MQKIIVINGRSKMEKVLGIIAEYNPLHNGHKFQIEEAKKKTGADYVIAVISGNFMQRGTPSIVNKWAKAEMALENGIDMVIELPTLYAISSGENFADGAIKILNLLGIVNYISFGTETSEIGILETFSDILSNEPQEYKNLLSSELSKGISFPKARENALIEYLKPNAKSTKSNIISSLKKSKDSSKIIVNKFHTSTYKKILESPNNILGIEYLKSLKKYKSTIKPIIIERNMDFMSATKIRHLLDDKNLLAIKNYVPEKTFNIIKSEMNQGHYISNYKPFEKIIFYNLRKMTIEKIANLPDVSEGLENSIKKSANSCNTVDEFINNVKSKRYTQTRLQRILLYSLLGVTKQDIEISKELETPYIRILGMNPKGKKLLSKIKKQNPNLPIITSAKKFLDTNSNPKLTQMLEKDIFATNTYTLGYTQNSKANLDFTTKL